jgi:hypothetical protein
MYMRYRGGGVGHKISRTWDDFLQSDGAQMTNDSEDKDKDKDKDDPDRVEADEGEELDDDILAAEGYGAL